MLRFVLFTSVHWNAGKTCNFRNLSSEPMFVPAMDWILGMAAVFCFAVGLNTLALALGVGALISNIGIIALRLRAQARGAFHDDGWVDPKLFTAAVLVAAVWLFALNAGYID